VVNRKATRTFASRTHLLGAAVTAAFAVCLLRADPPAGPRQIEIWHGNTRVENVTIQSSSSKPQAGVTAAPPATPTAPHATPEAASRGPEIGVIYGKLPETPRSLAARRQAMSASTIAAMMPKNVAPNVQVVYVPQPQPAPIIIQAPPAPAPQPQPVPIIVQVPMFPSPPQVAKSEPAPKPEQTAKTEPDRELRHSLEIKDAPRVPTSVPTPAPTGVVPAGYTGAGPVQRSISLAALDSNQFVTPAAIDQTPVAVVGPDLPVPTEYVSIAPEPRVPAKLPPLSVASHSELPRHPATHVNNAASPIVGEPAPAAPAPVTAQESVHRERDDTIYWIGGFAAIAVIMPLLLLGAMFFFFRRLAAHPDSSFRVEYLSGRAVRTADKVADDEPTL
jgi:hypothetical protein